MVERLIAKSDYIHGRQTLHFSRSAANNNGLWNIAHCWMSFRSAKWMAKMSPEISTATAFSAPESDVT
jgi:hypothetical protein